MAFSRNLAFVIGIDAYGNGITPLRTAARDAEAIAAGLSQSHDYTVERLIDDAASLAALVALFEQTLPAEVTADDRLVLYFAGHGIAQSGDDGPEGYLVPADAVREDRGTLLSMVRVLRALEALPCRHLLLILDCCFAGSFRWASTRSFLPTTGPITRKRYERFLDDPAWQVLTSAADDQKALDVLDGLTVGVRQDDAVHSPFARALLDGLAGGADRPGPDGEKDGVITAAELYGHVRDLVETGAEAHGKTQTPGLWPLPRHGRGEFLFHVPGAETQLAPDPVLNDAANPWRGLAAYEAEHEPLFFGRQRVVDDLLQLVVQGRAPAILVTGASGTGKSSVVKAGLIPALAALPPEQRVTIEGPIRLGADPEGALAAPLARLATPPEFAPRPVDPDWAWRLTTIQPPVARRLLVIDQFEELWTMCGHREVRDRVLDQLSEVLASGQARLLVTVRSDFLPRIEGLRYRWNTVPKRLVVPPFTRDELRDVVMGPAGARVLYFDPPELVERLLDEVAGVPGLLPMLSFTLAEMYREYVSREADDRALRGDDYDSLGGVGGSLSTRAGQLFDGYDADHQSTLERVFLRLASREGGDLAKRRAPIEELDMDERSARVITDFVAARLFVQGSVDGDYLSRGHVEPVHDILPIAWDRVHLWLDRNQEAIPILRRLWPAAWEWHFHSPEEVLARSYLWNESPYLPAAQKLVGSGLLNVIETDFVQRSVAWRDTLARRTRAAVGVALTLIVAAAIAAIWFGLEANARARETAKALEQTRLAQQAADTSAEQARTALVVSEARRVALHAEQELREGNLQTGALLAVSADGMYADLPKVRSVVREAALKLAGRPLAPAVVLPRAVRAEFGDEGVEVAVSFGGWRGMPVDTVSGRWSVPSPTPWHSGSPSPWTTTQGALSDAQPLEQLPLLGNLTGRVGRAGHTVSARPLAWSGDRRWLVSLEERPVDAKEVGYALRLTPVDRLWPDAPWQLDQSVSDAPAGLVRPPEREFETRSSWVAGGQTVQAHFIASSRGHLTTLVVEGGDLLLQATVRDAIPIEGGRLLVLSGRDNWGTAADGRVYLAELDDNGLSWDTSKIGNPVDLNRGHPEATVIAAGGDRVFAGLVDGSVTMWTVLGAGVVGETITLHEAPIVGLFVSADGRRVVSGDALGRIHVTPTSTAGYGRYLKAGVGRELTDQERLRFRVPETL